MEFEKRGHCLTRRMRRIKSWRRRKDEAEEEEGQTEREKRIIRKNNSKEYLGGS
jgi:hypothetical protein